MNRGRLIWILALVAATVAALLATGSGLLTKPLPGLPTLPSGTLLTWAGLVSLATVLNLLPPSQRAHTALQRVLKAILRLSLVPPILWAPLAYGLSGNWSFNFAPANSFQGSELARQLFWIMSYGAAVVPLLAFLLLAAAKGIQKRRREDEINRGK